MREIHLEDGQAYGWRQPPMLGGEESAENIEPVAAAGYIARLGRLGRSLRELTPEPGDDEIGYDVF